MSSKIKTTFECQSCGYRSNKWLGKCPECVSWSSFEEVQFVQTAKTSSGKVGAGKLYALNDVFSDDLQRFETCSKELNRVLGGGVVRGALMLLGGEPGVGKSTLMMEVCRAISTIGEVLYVSGEESASQISMRAQRLGVLSSDVKILPSVNLETILATIDEMCPKFIVLDSIQVISSDALPGGAGTVGQIRFCTEALMHTAKSKNIPMVVVGHVTKDGALAGPKVLEHLVDTVLYLEGESFSTLRILRCTKNRFGESGEVGVFEMHADGLKDISSPADFFLETRSGEQFGSSVSMTLEGSRVFLLEIQSLTTFSNFGYPKRTATGFDLNRLQLLIAILTKHAGANLQTQDVFVNVTGGLKLLDPACDLSAAMAILSSLYNKSLPRDTIFLGELGLTGELRAISNLERRVNEAVNLGFKRIFVPFSKKKLARKGLEIVAVKSISEVVVEIFG
jgi:DNA repair protein RadA/Sms